MSDATGRFVRVREAFDQIAALEPAQRDAAIAMACGSDCELARELRGLLDAHDRESGHTGDTRARMVDEGLVALTETTGSGDRIGPFLLREVLGRGGMGVVYRAERVDGEVKQQVAVKVMQRLHLDEAGIRRFSQERDIVAQLAHPYIARLFDAGTTRDGAPYYAMELVDGSSIVDWCDSRSADVGARLDIFLKVCEAVRFAHANLVLHRDIKPGNVLVDAAGDPKLIDFGIAKAMGASDATATGRQLFTPGNAAPEQLRGQHCGVACDVYQLGTLLYELLTGSTVLRTTDTTPAEIEESILRRVPPRPSDVVAQAGRPAAAQALRGADSYACDADQQDRQIAPHAVRRRAFATLHRGFEDAFRPRLQPLRDVALVVDHRRNAGIVGAQHRAAGFDGTHLRELQMLLGSRALAKPGVVADVDQ